MARKSFNIRGGDMLEPATGVIILNGFHLFPIKVLWCHVLGGLKIKAEVKSIVMASRDFNDFKTRIQNW